MQSARRIEPGALFRSAQTRFYLRRIGKRRPIRSQDLSPPPTPTRPAPSPVGTPASGPIGAIRAPSPIVALPITMRVPAVVIPIHLGDVIRLCLYAGWWRDGDGTRSATCGCANHRRDCERACSPFHDLLLPAPASQHGSFTEKLARPFRRLLIWINSACPLLDPDLFMEYCDPSRARVPTMHLRKQRSIVIHG